MGVIPENGGFKPAVVARADSIYSMMINDRFSLYLAYAQTNPPCIVLMNDIVDSCWVHIHHPVLVTFLWLQAFEPVRIEVHSSVTHAGATAALLPLSGLGIASGLVSGLLGVPKV